LELYDAGSYPFIAFQANAVAVIGSEPCLGIGFIGGLPRRKKLSELLMSGIF
jgi:hypothetical protein